MVTLGFEPSLPATHGTWLYIEYRQPRLFPFHPPSEASQRGRVTWATIGVATPPEWARARARREKAWRRDVTRLAARPTFSLSLCSFPPASQACLPRSAAYRTLPHPHAYLMASLLNMRSNLSWILSFRTVVHWRGRRCGLSCLCLGQVLFWRGPSVNVILAVLLFCD